MNFYTINNERQNKKRLMYKRIQQNTAGRDTSMGKISAYRKASPCLLFSPCPWVWNKDEDSRQISGIKINEMRECHRVAHIMFNGLNFVIALIFFILYYTVCPTRYPTRHFFNNSNINEDIATKFEQDYVCCVRNEKECVFDPLQISLQYPH
jgi:hypothetical protein